MLKILFTTVLVSLIILLPISINCREKKQLSGDLTGAITSSGLARTYLLHIPPAGVQSKSMPLLIALHGGGGTGRGMEQLTLGGFNTLADQDGFVVAYPDAIEKHWNDGRTGVSYRAHKEKIDDVGFISALIERLALELNIDQNRVYVTGISNGAMMSFRLAHDLSAKIAAIAAVSGSLAIETSTPYAAAVRPIPVLMINGTADPLIHWEGGKITLGLGFRDFGTTRPITETVKYWVNLNKCAPTPVISNEPDKAPNDGTKVQKEVYTAKTGNCEVILYKIEGGGHTWPGGYQYLSKLIIGKTCHAIDANQVIWDFFKRHKLK